MKTTATKRTISSRLNQESIKPTFKKVNKIIKTNSSNERKVNKINRLVESMEFKLINKSKKLTSLTRTHINGMLKSGIFTNEERKAVAVLIRNSKVHTLNENTAKILDANVSVIMSSKVSDKILTEGFFGDIWDGLQGLGDKAKDALKSGWSKVKGIWSEFTDLIKELVEAVKEMFTKMTEKIKDVVSGIVGEAKKVVDKGLSKINDKATLAKEVKELSDSGNYVKDWWSKSVGEGSDWDDKVIKGDFKAEDIKLDDKTIEAGEKELEKIADSIIHKRNGLQLVEDKRNLLSNPEVLNALLESRVRRFMLKEGGGFKHLEDSVKNPLLKGLIKYGINGIAWIIATPAKLAQSLVNFLTKKGLEGFSEFVKKISGPGIFAFVVLAGLLGEVVEIVVKKMTAESFAKLITGITIPVLAPFIAAFEFLEHFSNICLAYAVGTVMLNLSTLIK